MQRRKSWDELKRVDPTFTCAKLFWWYNMYSPADYTITPRPMYPADGRKVFDIYAWPPGVLDVKQKLGPFPFPAFWGPGAGVDTPQATRDAASHWIAASAKWLAHRHAPPLSLIYVPQPPYPSHRLGPNHPALTRHPSAFPRPLGHPTRS